MTLKEGKNNGIKIEFTDVLYGTVIAISFGRITKPEISIKLFMFFFSLVIIFDDWLLYHIIRSKIKNSARNYIVCYVLDISILITWYFSVLITPDYFYQYLLLIIIFYLICSIWDKIFNVPLLSQTDLPLCIYFGILLFLNLYFNISYSIIMPCCYIGFFLIRSFDWKNLLKVKDSEFNKL